MVYVSLAKTVPGLTAREEILYCLSVEDGKSFMSNIMKFFRSIYKF